MYSTELYTRTLSEYTLRLKEYIPVSDKTRQNSFLPELAELLIFDPYEPVPA